MTKSSLQLAKAAMLNAPDDLSWRMMYFERFAEADLVLALTDTPDGDNISPQARTLDGVDFLLVFEGEERLAQFSKNSAAFVALKGRDLVGMVAGQGLGIALNIHMQAESDLLDPATVDWLSRVLDNAPTTVASAIAELHPILDISKKEVARFAQKMKSVKGMADFAILARAIDQDGQDRPIAFFANPIDGSEDTLTQAVSEYQSFSESDDDAWDVGFCTDQDAVMERVLRVGLKIEIPRVEPALTVQVPGANPEKPPILR